VNKTKDSNMNVSIEDIKRIEQELGIQLTDEQRDAILKHYQRVVMDKGESWDVIIKELIRDICSQ
jgi:phenylalanyl-tRNA synthetase beta subunit